MLGETREDWLRGVSAWAMAAVTVVMTIAIFILLAPRFSKHHQLQISPSDVTVLPHDGDGPFRRRRVNETVYNLNSASQISGQMRRQYTHAFRTAEIPLVSGEVFVPLIGGTALVYFNGVRLGKTENMETYIPGYANQFILLEIPVPTYQTGINRLTIVLTPDSSFVGLPQLYFGKKGDFTEAGTRVQQSRNLLHVFLVIGSLALVFMAAIGLFARYRVRVYGPLLALGAGIAFLAFLSRSRSLQNSESLFLWMLLIYAVIGLAVVILSGIKTKLLGLWGAALISIVLALTVLMPFNLPSFTSSFVYFSAGGVIPFAALLGLICLIEDKGLANLRQARLKEKIYQQEAIILGQEAAIEEGLKAKGRLEERQRLTRDIHDGIGGQLLSLLVRVRDGGMSSEQIVSDLQYGLNDLRLIVDSMDHSEESLESAFVTFRTRAKAQLQAAGISLKWEQSDPFVPPYFGPAAILSIFRLMQEAVTNAIRHAQCGKISVQISRPVKEEDLVITMTDNGIGIDASSDAFTGQGLKNMQYRAKALGGILTLSEGHEGGTEVTLRIPIEAQSPEIN